MNNRIFSAWQSKTVAAIGLALLASTSVMAQDEPAPLPASKVVVSLPDGSKSVEYAVNDISVYISEIAAYEGVPAHNELSFSMSTITPVDKALLEWAALDGKDNLRNVSITATFSEAEGETREMQYELTGAHVTSFSTGHSTYGSTPVSLSVMADTVSIDGVPMN